MTSKIKCPFNCGEYDSTIINCHSELERHLKDNHDTGIMLSRLLTKLAEEERTKK